MPAAVTGNSRQRVLEQNEDTEGDRAMESLAKVSIYLIFDAGLAQDGWAATGGARDPLVAPCEPPIGLRVLVFQSLCDSIGVR